MEYQKIICTLRRNLYNKKYEIIINNLFISI
jgi:hypothetical protein